MKKACLLETAAATQTAGAPPAVAAGADDVDTDGLVNITRAQVEDHVVTCPTSDLGLDWNILDEGKDMAPKLRHLLKNHMEDRMEHKNGTNIIGRVIDNR